MKYQGGFPVVSRGRTHGSGSHALVRIVLSSGGDILKLMSISSYKICNRSGFAYRRQYLL